MRRRTFLQATGALAAAGLAPRAAALRATGSNELAYDVAVIGGGLGGCAAALAAARAGMRVVLAEPTAWLGGQLTSQAVPPDENRWIENGGANASYRRLRSLVRDYYARHYPLSDAARRQKHLNPGRGYVSRLCAEPRVWMACLEGMLAPFVASGKLTIMMGVEPALADLERDHVRAVTLRMSGGDLGATLTAGVFVDATENGDLLPLTRTEFVTGTEAQARTREPGAPTAARPDNLQAFTWCLAMEYRAGEDHTIERPESYAAWRDYVPDLTPPWTGKLFAFEATHPITLAPRRFRFAPDGNDEEQGPELFSYRRILDPRTFEMGAIPHPVTVVNWPQNDFLLDHLLCGRKERMLRERAARELSRSLLYWLQTEAPRSGDAQGWKGLRPRGDILGTEDGLALAPYIREARRIRAEFTVCEQHISHESRALEMGVPTSEATATPFPDSVGIGHYRIDLHPTTGGDNYLDVDCLPFQIPLGALLPVRMENLLPAAKNIGTTHITNGAYRMHPVEWAIGEAAGELAAFSLTRSEPIRAIRANQDLLEAYQSRLAKEGVPLSW